MSKAKLRAIVPDISGKERYEIIRAAISRYNYAMEQSFYLEATTLIESLLSDRLESRLGQLTKIPVNFDTIGQLLKKLNKVETDVELKNIMNKKLNIWCGQRNATIHQAVKIEMGKKKVWAEFLEDSKRTAIEGRKIFNEYNTQLQKIRRSKNKRNSKI
jgi:hypothetical protein